MILKIIPLGLLGVGVFVLMQVVAPFVAFKAWEVFSYDQNQLLLNPYPKSQVTKDGDILGVSVANLDNFPAFIGRADKNHKAPYSDFKLTAKTIKLEDIKVLTNSNDFEENLAQLPGSALPGERGNVFISGHSSILNTYNSGAKKAFFVHLPSMKKGDPVEISTLGQKFTYEVMGTRIVDPKDVSVIEPPDEEGRYLTLMTCVPPGFNTKRLIVLAKLKS